MGALRSNAMNEERKRKRSTWSRRLNIQRRLDILNIYRSCSRKIQSTDG